MNERDEGAESNMPPLDEIVRAATQAARQYRQLTGKPLGITGEIGEVLAAQLLGLELASARQAGYDALAPDGRRVQIKARCVLRNSKPRESGDRMEREKIWRGETG